MAQHHPDQSVTDEEFFESLRDDPDVIVHYRKTTEPYVPRFR
ncbi:MAG TPA: hypothetical protein VH482_12555 [Thermomicrobiales bacterium]|jgi:hypothetical protein